MDPLTNMPSTRRVAEARLPTRYGTFSLSVYLTAEGKEHIALTVGTIEDGEPVIVRLHSECATGDLFGSSRCDCGEQLQDSLRYLQEQGRGILLYMRQEGRGIGLVNKIRAYAIQDQGFDTVEANRALGLPEDMRDYGDAAGMLIDLGVQQIYLMTNNPSKIEGLERHAIKILERLPLHVQPNPHNLGYLRTKQEKMGHLISLGDYAFNIGERRRDA